MLELLLLIAALLGGGLLIYMYRLAHRDRLLYHELTFNEFPDSFGEVKLFFISDIHRRIISDSLLDKVRNKVDLVIIGGDLLEKGVPLGRVEQNIKKLSELGLTYFVWGNNDYEIDSRVLDGLLLKYGVKILDNTAASLQSHDDERIVLLGIDDISKYRDRLDLALQDADEGFRVLVSHNPQVMNKLKKEHHISLVLSGHTHGGQIRIFGWGLYEKGKIEQVDNTCILVSNGYGTTTLPLRLGAKPEVHFITLKKS